MKSVALSGRKSRVRPSTHCAYLDAAEQTTVARHRQCDPPKLAHQMRGDLDWIVMKALEKDRARRYETASGLAADLKRHLDNEPVVARPPSPAYRLQKAVRRNRLAFGAGAVVVLALLAGLTVAALGWRQTRAERDMALQARTGEELQRKAAQASEQKTKEREAEIAHLLYAADMNLAEQAWNQNNVARLRQLLTRNPGTLSTVALNGITGKNKLTAPFSRSMGAYRSEFPRWPFPRTAGASSPPQAGTRPRCGTRRLAASC